MTSVTINDSQRLFVIPSGSGFSCLGFDVAFKRMTQYAQALRRALPSKEAIGTLDQYNQYLEYEQAFVRTNPQETFYEADTSPEVIKVLETYRKSGDSLRVFTGDITTGRDWCNEWDVLGHISRSTGPIKIPLLCDPRSDGGFALLSASILRLTDAGTKRDVYRHPLYQMPEFTINPSTAPGYTHETLRDGQQVHARFKSLQKAKNWVAFMRGERMTTA